MDLCESVERLDLGMENSPVVSSPRLNFPSSEDFRVVLEELYTLADPFTIKNTDLEKWCSGNALDWNGSVGNGIAPMLTKKAMRSKAVGQWNQARRATMMPNLDSFGSLVSLATQPKRKKSRSASAEVQSDHSSDNTSKAMKGWSLIKRRTSVVDACSSKSHQRRTSREDHKQLKLKAAAARGWRRIRRFVEDLKFQRQTSKANTSWAMLRHHFSNMSHAQRTRRDIYERYGIVPRLTADGTFCTNNIMLSTQGRELISLQQKPNPLSARIQ